MILQYRILSRSLASSTRFISSLAISQQIKQQKANAAKSVSQPSNPDNYQKYLNPTVSLAQDKLTSFSKHSNNNANTQTLSTKFLLNETPYSMDGVFAINKPAGPTSADAVAALKGALNSSELVEGSRAWAKANGLSGTKLRRNLNWKKKQVYKRKHANEPSTDVKVGHGGTLDPLASGVIVIGIGNGTRKLQEFLTECTKVYESTAVFGASTTTYDVTGNVLEYANNVDQIVTEDSIKDAISKSFSGNIVQYPPVYSALKMDGKRLYEYAREGVPLPRKIEARDVRVDFFEVVPGSVKVLTKQELTDDDGGIASVPADEEEKKFYLRETMPPVGENLRQDTEPEKYVVARLRFAVSSGTYIRSLVHDLARSLGVVGYMQKLERVRQGPFVLNENVFDLHDIVTHVRSASREKLEKSALDKQQQNDQKKENGKQGDDNANGNNKEVKSNTSKNGYTEQEWVAMIKKMIAEGPELKIKDIKTQIAEELKVQKEKEAAEAAKPKEELSTETKEGEPEVESKQESNTESSPTKAEPEAQQKPVSETEPVESTEPTEQEKDLEGPPAKKIKTDV